MILEIHLHIREGFWSVSCADIPGLNLCGDDRVLHDFVEAWRKMHELVPKQVMPVPRCTTLYAKKARGGKAGGVARAALLSPERRSEIAQKAAKTRWKK